MLVVSGERQVRLADRHRFGPRLDDESDALVIGRRRVVDQRVARACGARERGQGPVGGVDPQARGRSACGQLDRSRAQLFPSGRRARGDIAEVHREDGRCGAGDKLARRVLADRAGVVAESGSQLVVGVLREFRFAGEGALKDAVAQMRVEPFDPDDAERLPDQFRRVGRRVGEHGEVADAATRVGRRDLVGVPAVGQRVGRVAQPQEDVVARPGAAGVRRVEVSTQRGVARPRR